MPRRYPVNYCPRCNTFSVTKDEDGYNTCYLCGRSKANAAIIHKRIKTNAVAIGVMWAEQGILETARQFGVSEKALYNSLAAQEYMLLRKLEMVRAGVKVGVTFSRNRGNGNGERSDKGEPRFMSKIAIGQKRLSFRA